MNTTAAMTLGDGRLTPVEAETERSATPQPQHIVAATELAKPKPRSYRNRTCHTPGCVLEIQHLGNCRGADGEAELEQPWAAPLTRRAATCVDVGRKRTATCVDSGARHARPLKQRRLGSPAARRKVAFPEPSKPVVDVQAPASAMAEAPTGPGEEGQAAPPEPWGCLVDRCSLNTAAAAKLALPPELLARCMTNIELRAPTPRRGRESDGDGVSVRASGAAVLCHAIRGWPSLRRASLLGFTFESVDCALAVLNVCESCPHLELDVSGSQALDGGGGAIDLQELRRRGKFPPASAARASAAPTANAPAPTAHNWRLMMLNGGAHAPELERRSHSQFVSLAARLGLQPLPPL